MRGPLEFREMLRDHEDTKREYRELNAKYEALRTQLAESESKCAKMRELLGECRDELDDRYDGAPDSVTRWAGHLVAKIDAILQRWEGGE